MSITVSSANDFACLLAVAGSLRVTKAMALKQVKRQKKAVLLPLHISSLVNLKSAHSLENTYVSKAKWIPYFS